MIVLQAPLSPTTLGIANALLAHNITPGGWDGGNLPKDVKHLFITDASKFGYSQNTFCAKNNASVWFCNLEIPKLCKNQTNVFSIFPECYDSRRFHDIDFEESVEYDVLVLNPTGEIDAVLDNVNSVCAVLSNEFVNSKYYKGSYEDIDMIGLAKRAKLVVDGGSHYWDIVAFGQPVITELDADYINKCLIDGVSLQTGIKTYLELVDELGILR